MYTGHAFIIKDLKKTKIYGTDANIIKDSMIKNIANITHNG